LERPLAIGAMRPLSTMLFGLTPNDATTFGQVGLIITVAALVACVVPPFRAMRIASVPLRGERRLGLGQDFAGVPTSDRSHEGTVVQHSE
jgi:hypothetical protein